MWWALKWGVIQSKIVNRYNDTTPTNLSLPASWYYSHPLSLGHTSNPRRPDARVLQFNTTPLHFAAEKGQALVARTLLDRGAEVDARSKERPCAAARTFAARSLAASRDLSALLVLALPPCFVASGPVDSTALLNLGRPRGDVADPA